MMHSNFGTYMPEALPPYSYDTMIDNTYDTQMALSQAARRLSRGSNGQRTGSTMRVSKPNSTSTSPRSSMMARRRTMVNDAQTMRRHQQAMDYISATHGMETSQPQPQRQARPVSWHPSTHLQAPQPQHFPQQALTLSTPAMYHDQSDMYSTAPQYSPMMTTYSNNTSPSSSFSPLPVAYQCVDTMSHMSADAWQLDERATMFPALNDNQYLGESCLALNGLPNDKVSVNGLEWNTFIMNGFNSTSPPTPDSFVQTTQLPQSAMSEASIQDLDEPEEEGEILVGMGLYDDKYEEDPHLNNYRSTVSSLLGSTFRPQEPKGKGLKLEETWEPPKSDDEDEEEDEEEDDDEEDDDSEN
ncbi:hypothetical protein PT974_06700 [Cladobotryum mycophilum]|uniref:Uncharacterized protein n=1 Tax=Cladobotryum mycophilum TaxID=491253 RepID=A0ABR0SNA4_9HYPO